MIHALRKGIVFYLIIGSVFNMISDDVIIGKGTQIWHPELSNIYGCKIGENCNIGALVEIRRDVTIGNNCKIQAFAFIPEGITIGNNVFIGPHVCFTNDKHPRVDGEWEVLQTIVEDDVSIGANVTICPGVILGAGAMIAAGSIIVNNVPPKTLVKNILIVR